jgi:hypothetical protein
LKSKLKYILILLLDFGYYNSNSQNLIANGSFENYTNIDCTYGGLDNANSPYNHVLDNWYGYNTPDYFNFVCSSSGWFNVPYNVFGNAYAKTNNAYVGISVFQANNLEYKEYIYQQLLSPLQSGKLYCLSFFVSKADRKEYAIKNIGAYICNTLPIMVSNMCINTIPQVVNTNAFVSDTTQWTEIQGCFTANGGEQYIIIGNFNSNLNTDTLYTGTNNPISGDPQYSYYYIDDITLIDQATVGINEFNKTNSFVIYPNPTNSILNIRGKNQQLQNTTIEIRNTLGQIVYFDVYAAQIDISYLPSGIYFITLNTKETKRTIKFVKE